MYKNIKLYNREEKIAFAKQYTTNENTRMVVLYDFQKAELYERHINKDLSEIKFEGVEDIIKQAKSTSLQSIKRMLSVFNTYFDWRISNRKSVNRLGINYYKIYIDMDDSKLRSFIHKSHSAKKYLLADDVDTIISRLINPVDKAIIMGFYEGIKGTELYELRSLRLNNIKTVDGKYYKAKVINKDGSSRELAISRQLMQLFVNSKEQVYYHKANGKGSSMKNPTLYMADTPYVIKPLSTSKNTGEMMTKAVLIQRIKNISRYIDASLGTVGNYDFITPQSIFDSGVINKLISLYDNGIIDSFDPPVIRDYIQEYNFTNIQMVGIKGKAELMLDIRYD